jgi:aerobic C4-dicarboxylate transport protein
MRILKSLYFYVLVAIATGIILGIYFPDFAAQLKPLADGFIKLIKMMIAPLIFCTIVTGIAGMQNTREAGRVGVKAILYFEILTTVALIIGLVIVNVFHPGSSMHVNAATLDTSDVEGYLIIFSQRLPKEIYSRFYFLRFFLDSGCQKLAIRQSR